MATQFPGMNVTVVIPFYNEAENIAPLAAELDAVRQTLPALTVVFVDDGSRDGTWAAIEQAGASRPWLRGVRHDRNRGQSAAMLTGLRAASGDILVTMDGDLQNDPADIPALVAQMAEADVVCGYRAHRRDTLARRIGSRLGNAVRRWVTHDGIRDTGCSLKAFRRECVGDLPPLNGVHRFMPAYFLLHGRRIREVPVNHRPRQHGVSKYTNLKRLPKTLFDLLGFYWYRTRLLADKPPA
jgi:dolichol-phosphate mannosyltransferase